jgi:hypothetical protein
MLPCALNLVPCSGLNLPYKILVALRACFVVDRIQVQRRTWDAEEYQKRADEKREEAERLEREVFQYCSQYPTSPFLYYTYL